MFLQFEWEGHLNSAAPLSIFLFKFAPINDLLICFFKGYQRIAENFSDLLAFMEKFSFHGKIS